MTLWGSSVNHKPPRVTACRSPKTGVESIPPETRKPSHAGSERLGFVTGWGFANGGGFSAVIRLVTAKSTRFHSRKENSRAIAPNHSHLYL